MYMYLYSLALMAPQCTLGAAFYHKAPPLYPLYTQPRDVEYELGVLRVRKLSRPERDWNPRYPAWKSSALTTRPPGPQSLDEIQATLIYSRTSLSLWRQSAVDRGLSTILTGTFGTSANSAVPDQTPQIRVCTVCLNCRNIRIKSPFRAIFPAYTQRQSLHQCSQCFDCN